VPCIAFGQQSLYADSVAANIRCELLPDSNFNFNQVLTGKQAGFVAGNTLQPGKAGFYWLKLTIAAPLNETGAYHLFANYFVSNTLYYFDANTRRWISHTRGIAAKRNPLTEMYAMPLILQARPQNIVYVKMDVSHLNKAGQTVQLFFLLQKKSIAARRLLISWAGWVAALAVVLFFFLYNVYMYISFRDVSTMYYLITQVGVMVYITGYRWLFGVFLPRKVFTILISPNNSIGYYDVNSIANHLSVIVIMFGLVQLTRSYLNTQKYIKRMDAVLKYGMYAYALAALVLVVINVFFTCIDRYTLRYENIFVLLLTGCIIYTCVAGYRKKLPASRAFLVAHLLPLVLITVVALSHVFTKTFGSSFLWLPNLAIVSQAFGFSVVLVARTKLIQTALTAKETEAQELGFENEKISAGIQYEVTRNELLQHKLETNQRELASTTLYMVQKNELLATLKTELAKLKRLNPGAKPEGLAGIETLLQTNLFLDDDWSKFRLHFEQVHPGFFENLQQKHPGLTKNEVRLSAYFHINLSSKEIATLLNIEPDSVRRAKSRLLKKMGYSVLPEDV
jgi:hypothetical protein